MSDSNNQSSSEFMQFVESVKAKIPIDELYTKLTGEEFIKEDARPRAKISWREDNSPSLCYFAASNLLTDFTDKLEGSDKAGRSYNVLDILQKCGGAINFAHALQMACELTNTEFPDKFKKKSNKELGHLPYNIGSKIHEVWEACQQYLKYCIDNPNKRPISLTNTFEERHIPFDWDFLESLNLGFLPNYDVTYQILQGHGILRKGKEDKELNIHTPDFGNNALVYPLYNIDGGLCGLRFRRLDKKDFSEWVPTGPGCFYNAQRFKRRPYDRQIMVVEGEMNLVAYGVAAWNHLLKLKTDKKEIIKDLDTFLTLMYSTGSKSNSVNVFKDQVKNVFYLQDHDITKVEEDMSPKDHPVLKTCMKIAKEINADNLVLADWEKLPYVQKKFDLEDYLNHNNGDLKSLIMIDKISLPRYAINCIKKYCNTIENTDNKRETQIKYTVQLSDSLQYSQRQVFSEIAKKEFAIDDEVSQNILSQQREVKCDDYSIDQLGRIIQTTIDDNGNKRIRPVTNFYMRINDETTYYSHIDNSQKKYYNVEVVLNGKSAGMSEVSSEDIFDNKVMASFLPTVASTTDLNFIDPSLRDKNFKIITSLMNSIPIPLGNKKYIFSSLGRPFEIRCAAHFGTENFCLFPKISIINGEIIENSTFDVCLSPKEALVNTSFFEFSKLTDEEYHKAINLFWYDLRHTHDCNIIDSLIGTVFDSITREMQGFGVVDNAHGFPIYLAGQSGAYKSTSAIMAMSLLGKFKGQNDLLAWNGTPLSIQYELMQAGTATHTLDDMKVDDMSSKEFINFFHTLYGGISRKRMDSTGTKIKGGNKVECSCIITAENENANIPEAIAARMLVLRVLKCNNQIGAERKYHLDKMLLETYDNENYNIDLMRGLTPRIVAWIQKRGITPYITSLKKWKTIFAKVIEDRRNNTERPSDMVARIVSAFEQICEFLKSESSIPEKEIDSRLETFVEFWHKQIRNQMVRIEKQSSTNKIVDFLCQIINSEIIGIKVYKDERWHPPTRIYQGYPIRDVTYPDGKHKLLLISTLAIVKAINFQLDTNGQQISVDRLESDLKETGIIETDANSKTIFYPLPDENNKITKTSKQALAIDYDKLMDMYTRNKE